MANTFLEQTDENGDYNQYWYSAKTISNIVGLNFTTFLMYCIVWYCTTAKL